MRFTPEFLDELRARLPVSEVVGRRVKLKKAGREWKGLSPFQQEKSPSFTVNDQKGFYHDFSSGKHGDIFSFLMETEGVGFTEAGTAGRDGRPSVPAVSPDAARQAERRRSLYDVMELAANSSPRRWPRAWREARGYLGDRGISPADPAAVPSRLCAIGTIFPQGTSRLLGIPVEDMVEAGFRYPVNTSLSSPIASGIADVSYCRPARARDRVRWSRAGKGCRWRNT